MSPSDQRSCTHSVTYTCTIIIKSHHIQSITCFLTHFKKLSHILSLHPLTPHPLPLHPPHVCFYPHLSLSPFHSISLFSPSVCLSVCLLSCQNFIYFMCAVACCGLDAIWHTCLLISITLVNEESFLFISLCLSVSVCLPPSLSLSLTHSLTLTLRPPLPPPPLYLS